jgi:glutamate/tyrosine decarboxylase-like PLP-dependent enzyme
VDAALGGAVIFSQKLMEGKQNMFEDVDSITIDPHKGLVVPLQLSSIFGQQALDSFSGQQCSRRLFVPQVAGFV